MPALPARHRDALVSGEGGQGATTSGWAAAGAGRGGSQPERENEVPSSPPWAARPGCVERQTLALGGRAGVMAQSGHIWGHRWLAMTVGVTASLAWFSVCNVLPIPEHRKAPTSQVLAEEEAMAASVTRPEGVGTSTYPSPSVQTAASPRPLRRPPGTPVLLQSVISLKMNSRKWAGDSHRESRLPGWT